MWVWLTGVWNTATAIAVVALVQPWVYWFYRKYGRGGHLDVHHTGNIEIGFSTLGATIGLQGTLRSLDREFFVSSMTLDIVRESDNSQHTLEWAAFRPPLVLVGEPKDPVEMPAGFLLQPTAPRRYHIMFNDSAAQAAAKQVTDPLQAAWFAALSSKGIPSDKHQEYYDTEFRLTPLHVTTFSDLDPIMYWQAGSYRLRLRIHTTRPDRDFQENWKFSLTPTDVSGLRGNRIPTILTALNLTGRWHFAYSRYQ